LFEERQEVLSDQGFNPGSDPVSLDERAVSPGSDFPSRLDRLARLLGATSDLQLAHRLGFSKTTVFNWRHGVNTPYRSTLAKIAERTGARLEWLETGEGEVFAEPPTNVPAVAGQLRAGDPLVTAAPPAAAPPPEPRRLVGQVQLDRLVDAYEAATRATKGLPVRERMRFTLIIYDELSEAAETQAKAGSQGSHPQDGQPEDPQMNAPSTAVAG
jgi:transcriptional regulator with XRE-family HTH domain